MRSVVNSLIRNGLKSVRMIWRYHFYAISFFSNEAKLTFFPSVLVLSMTEMDQVQLAVESYLWDFAHRWELLDMLARSDLSGNRIALLKYWLLGIRESLHYKDAEYIALIIERIDLGGSLPSARPEQ